MRNRNEAPAAILANVEVFDYLKEKVGERKTRTEAYCDLLDKSLAGFVSPVFKKAGLRPLSLPVPCNRFRPCIGVALASGYCPLVSGHARSARTVRTHPAGKKRRHYHAPADRHACHAGQRTGRSGLCHKNTGSIVRLDNRQSNLFRCG